MECDHRATSTSPDNDKEQDAYRSETKGIYHMIFIIEKSVRNVTPGVEVSQPHVAEPIQLKNLWTPILYIRASQITSTSYQPYTKNSRNSL